MTKEQATYIAAGLLVLSTSLSSGDVSPDKQIKMSEVLMDAAILVGKNHGLTSVDLLKAMVDTMGDLK